MNAHVAIIEPVDTDGAVSFVADPQTPLAVLTDKAQADSLIARVKAEIAALVPDPTTAKGREAIKSLAFKVTKTKTAVDAARKLFTEEARKKVDTTNAAGRVIWDQLEALAVAARKPLTDWEQAEKDRIEAVANRMAEIERSANVFTDDSADAIAGRITILEAMTFDPDVYREGLDRATDARASVIATLTSIHARLVQEEADRAELAALRAAAAAREEEARLATLAAEAKAKEEADALAAKEREEEIARKAADDAKAEAARVAQKALDDQAAAHQAELDAIQKAADEKAATEKVEADQAAQREKNRAHVAKIMGAAKLAIMGLGIPEEQAVAVVKAIKAGSVPNVSIQF